MFTNDDELARSLRRIARHGQEKRYYHLVIGVNSRLDTLQAAILLPKLAILESELVQRQRVADKYMTLLSGIDEISLPKINQECKSAWAQFTVRVENRTAVLEGLTQRNIPTAIHYPMPLNHQPAVADKAVNLPIGNLASEQVFSLPMHPYMEDCQIEEVSYALQQSIQSVS